MINELLRSKYSDFIFYCHNLGGYDVVFILKALYNYNDKCLYSKDKYNISCILRNDKIIKVTIKKDMSKVIIVDSYCMFTTSLNKLGRDFDVKTLKSVFPYKFATDSHLFYKGNTPDIEFYNDMSKEQYKLLYTDNWSFKDETIKYLNNDLDCLYEIMIKGNRQIFLDFNINIMEAITISGLVMKIYLNKFYKDNIPSIKKPSIYADLKKAYYGGITEVYKPYGQNLFYYDVNSLYPFAALSSMPGLNCNKMDFIDNPYTDLDELFGFFYCDITTPINNYLGLLPIINKTGIEFPLGSWHGWYFSEELKLAKKNGYKIKIYKGYMFSKEDDVFKDYVNTIYKIKSNPINPTQKSIAKSLLNNLLGRFGINLDKSTTEVMSSQIFSEICIVLHLINIWVKIKF